jgi:hypothetical protein
MIGAGIVKIDGLFDEPQPEYLCVERRIGSWVRSDGSDVMDTG